MNFINRLIVVLLLAVLLVFSCISIFLVLFARGAISTALQPTLSAISAPDIGATQLLCLGVAILAFVFTVLLLYLELMPSGKMRMHLKSIQGAEVLMSADAITTQLQYALDPLPGVIRATPRVARGKGDAVDVFVDMLTTADIDIKQKTDEVMDMTRSVLEGGLGLRVGKVQIKIEQMKPPKRGLPALPKLDLPQIVSGKVDEAAQNASQS
ncbi:MAG TPA: hypothetical protein VFD70_23690 [Anaerolineae bacterium]|nr:hypothetical protein [Anaerolineae bacterium]